MASSSGISSSSTGCEENSKAMIMDQRKRKRMISNRESARRSRMRKQKHVDDLMTQLTKLRNENHQIITSINITTQHYLNIESENSVLRAQFDELSHRLHSLNEIITFLNSNNNYNNNNNMMMINEPVLDIFMNPLNLSCLNQPIMASADMFQY